MGKCHVSVKTSLPVSPCQALGDTIIGGIEPRRLPDGLCSHRWQTSSAIRTGSVSIDSDTPPLVTPATVSSWRNKHLPCFRHGHASPFLHGAVSWDDIIRLRCTNLMPKQEERVQKHALSLPLFTSTLTATYTNRETTCERSEDGGDRWATMDFSHIFMASSTVRTKESRCHSRMDRPAPQNSHLLGQSRVHSLVDPKSP